MSNQHEKGIQETVFGVKLGTVVIIVLGLMSAVNAGIGIWTHDISINIKEITKTVAVHSEEIAAIKVQALADKKDVCNLQAQLETLQERQLQVLVYLRIKPTPAVQPNYDILNKLNINGNNHKNELITR